MPNWYKLSKIYVGQDLVRPAPKDTCIDFLLVAWWGSWVWWTYAQHWWGGGAWWYIMCSDYLLPQWSYPIVVWAWWACTPWTQWYSCTCWHKGCNSTFDNLVAYWWWAWAWGSSWEAWMSWWSWWWWTRTNSYAACCVGQWNKWGAGYCWSSFSAWGGWGGAWWAGWSTSSRCCWASWWAWCCVSAFGKAFCFSWWWGWGWCRSGWAWWTYWWGSWGCYTNAWGAWSTCWSWWWGWNWGWAWANWVFLARYPANCWYDVTWWTKFECNWYCVHCFTSDWTLTVS